MFIAVSLRRSLTFTWRRSPARNSRYFCRARGVPCRLTGGLEVSPSPVYGARLLSGLRASTLSGVQIPAPPPLTWANAPPEGFSGGASLGRPSVAALRLLKANAPTSRLHLRADGDEVGWAIVASLQDSFPAADRWRMPDGSAQYEEEILDSLIGDLPTVADSHR